MGVSGVKPAKIVVIKFHALLIKFYGITTWCPVNLIVSFILFYDPPLKGVSGINPLKWCID